MDFHSNYYGLVFISPVEQSDYIDLFKKTNSSTQKLIDTLRADKNIGGYYDDTLIISSPDILDFFPGDLGPFAEKLIRLFPTKNIFATYHNSVTSQRGICHITNSKVTDLLYSDDPAAENTVDDIEDAYVEKYCGYRLPSLLGLPINMADLS